MDSLLAKLIKVCLLGALCFCLWAALIAATPQKGSPFQTRVAKTPPSDGVDEDWIEVVEPYEITALVLSTKAYGDFNGDIAPVDLALAWGDLTNPKLAENLQVWQDSRFFYWVLPPNKPLARGDVISQTANVHMISLSPKQEETLQSIRRGDLIQLKGHLVNIHKQGRSWKTSTSRTDSGAGACEIFLTSEITPLKKNLLP